MKSSIPYTIPLNTPKTIQTPSSLVDSSLVSYAMLLISNNFKSYLFFIGWLYMKLVIIVLILPMYGFFLNTYGSYLNSIHQFSLVAQPFSTLALYIHGDIKPLVFLAQYDNIYDISESI